MNFKLYNHLGFHNPYYIEKEGKFIITNEFNDIISQGDQRVLDFTALVQVISAGYSFGDRTLLKDVQKTPWMARPSIEGGSWNYFDVPSHDEKIYSAEYIAERFYDLLKAELRTYISGRKNIGILITGGMDSRIVACVLNNMMKHGEMENISVLGITWGNYGSRDVVYGKQICDIYGWDWKHVVVDAEQMYENINIAADMGCAFSPIHLHAMSKVASIKGLDCILAGSFGDSVGRAEFSGIKVENLKSLLGKINNVTGFLRQDYLALSYVQSADDIKNYHLRFPQSKTYMLMEQDQQLHYMRRMLNACMSVIDRSIPLFQMFSAPEVFGFMWSIDPKLRTDLIYKMILDKYANELTDIPWARTGKRYMIEDSVPDNYAKRHHNYGEMLRTELYSDLENRILKSSLLDSGVFNKSTVRNILKACHKMPIKNSYFYEERLAYLASLAIFIDKYHINIDLPDRKSSMWDGIKPMLRYFAKLAITQSRL